MAFDFDFRRQDPDEHQLARKHAHVYLQPNQRVPAHLVVHVIMFRVRLHLDQPQGPGSFRAGDGQCLTKTKATRN